MKNNFTSYWVIFDTCTKPPYYQDVHNLLALPEDTIFRYNYAEKLLSADALRFCKEWPKSPKQVLLAYGQYEGFKRGSDERTFDPNTKKIWVPTRLAELEHVYTTGSDYFFDLRLKSFPFIDTGALGRIITELNDKGDVPFSKWVSISGCSSELAVLTEKGSYEDNWHAIVKWFQKEGTQFSKDSFWSLRGPYSGAQNKRVTISTRTSKTKENGRSRILGKESEIPLSNQQEVWFEVLNREPRNFEPPPAGSPTGAKVADGHEMVSGRSILIEDKSGRIPTETPESKLRPYFSRSLRFKAKSNKLLAKERSVVSFQTTPQETEWPEGPNFSLTFRTGWLLWRIGLGVVVALAGLVAIFYADKLPDTDLNKALWFFGGGTLSVIISSYLIYRELKFKY